MAKNIKLRFMPIIPENTEKIAIKSTFQLITLAILKQSQRIIF